MEKVKIVGICGSSRKGATQYALEQALTEAEKYGAEVEMITLRGKKINFCIQCDKCVREKQDHCVIYDDDMQDYYEKVYQADGIIIASPVYNMAANALTLAFINRFRSSFLIAQEKPEFFSTKLAAAITTGGTRNGGEETANGSIVNACSSLGFTCVSGGIGTYTGGCVWSQDRKAEGAKEDTIGINNCRKIGRKITVMASIIKEGKKVTGEFPVEEYVIR